MKSLEERMIRSSRTLSRRTLLAVLGGASAALLAACGQTPPAPTQAPTKTEAKPAAAEPTKPAAAPEPTKPAAAAAAPSPQAGAQAPGAAARPEGTRPAEKPAGAAPQAAAPSTGAAASKITFQSRGGDPLLKVAQGLVAEYNKAFPKNEVVIDHTNGDHFQKLQLSLAAGTPPDTYFDASLRTGGLAWKKGIIEDLEPYLKSDFKEDEYLKEMWIAMVYDGKRISVPYDSG